MLVPMSDLAMQLIGQRRREFDEYTSIPAPPLSVYEAVSDKYRLMKLAMDLEVPIPDTIFIEEGRLPADLKAVGEFPLIVKPSRSRVQINGTWVATVVQQAANRKELEHQFRETPYLRYPSLLQRCVEGEGQGIFALCDRGSPVALFAHRRLREKPPSGGVSVLRESIELPKTVAEYAVRLLQKTGWHGVAMVEFKIERETGIPRLMEINGRFWGSLQLALDAGMNFPFFLCQLAMNQPIAVPAHGYRIGVKSRWLLGDLDHLLLRLFKSDKTLKLPPGYPSRWQCAKDFFHFISKDLYYEIERWDDLSPARYEIGTYLKTLLKGNA